MSRSTADFRAGLEKFKRRLVVKDRRRLLIVLGVLSAVVTGLALYFGLMPIHPASGGFRLYLVGMLLIWSVPLLFKSEKAGARPKVKSGWGAPFLAALFLLVLFIVLALSVSPLFMAKEYRGLVTVRDDGDFAAAVENYDSMQIPVVDRNLAVKLGDKKLGEDNYGSQFEVGDYNMIAYDGGLYWIAPVEYRGFFQWTGRAESPGYIRIDALDPSDVQLVRCEMNYVGSAYLWDDLSRKSYFSHMFRYREAGAPHLELDDAGRPMFVQSVVTRRFAFTAGTDAVGVIVTDPAGGKSTYYAADACPDWIDRVYPESVVSGQLGYWGKYVHGFFNALFAKRDVLELSTGINYIYNNGRMYLQTGMTSVGGDESIVGVTMTDVRTKETTFYRVAGATEYAAAQSALGAEQAQRFTASDPIMINFNGIPTYFMTLKDDEGLVKRYAYVNVADYRLVAVDADRTAALAAYERLVSPDSATVGLTLTVADIRDVIIDGNTVYYIRFVRPEGASTLPDDFERRNFRAPLTLTSDLAFLQAGDTVTADLFIGSGEDLVTALTVHG